jgi:hypothetical protein
MNMKDGCFVYHESVELPMYHASYEVVVGSQMAECLDHVSYLCGGVALMKSDHSRNIPGYSCVVSGKKVGKCFYVLIALDDVYNIGFPPLSSTIIHEATHLSWFMLDELGIKITAGNHEMQCYMMEHLVSEITRVVDSTKDKMSLENL